jgi:raffinose/stachyose/melibiose transport system substrate-binding protein
MSFKAFFGAAAVATALAAGAANAQDVTVRMLQVNQTNQPLWEQIAENYNKTHPGVKVTVEYLENEAYKAKLPTLLQSEDKPDIIYSWGGGVMRAQDEAGYIQDISAARADLEKNIYPAALDAYSIDGKQVGIPYDFSQVALFYNKALMEKAGVDPKSMETWDGFLAAVKKLKEAGITPIVMGAGEKWPMHFYWSYLVMRLGGPDVLKKATAGEDGGFNNPVFIEAGKKLKELADLEPFQDGWLGTLFPASGGMFGDGKGAIDLMGNWLLGTQKENAADGKGLPVDQIGFVNFPTIPGGKGNASETLGGIGGFLITEGAPPEALDFMKFFTSPEQQKVAAEQGFYVPAVKGTDAVITNPLIAEVSRNVAASPWHQLFFDQDLGPSVGRVVNDVSVAIAAGEMTPEDGAAAIQEAWDQQ